MLKRSLVQDGSCLRTAMTKLLDSVPAAEIAGRLGISKTTVYSNQNWLKETETTKNRPRSSIPKTASTSAVIKKIREKVRRKSQRVRAYSWPKNFLPNKLWRRSLECVFAKAQFLTNSVKTVMLKRSRTLLKCFGAARRRRILLMVERARLHYWAFLIFNQKRQSCCHIEEANRNGRVASSSGYSKSVMVL